MNLELFLFTADPELARAAIACGIRDFVVDWENRDKEMRQQGYDTEINANTVADLGCIAGIPGCRVHCRINRPGPWTGAEVEQALAGGARSVFLPMVRQPREVEEFLEQIDGRCEAGILVETTEACACASELARFDLDRVYLGLNDLAISRGSRSIFEAMADGLADKLRETFWKTDFGIAGLTDVDLGHPIPCRLLIAEIARLHCQFTFLRRSFKRDMAHRGLRPIVEGIRARWEALEERSMSDVAADRAEFLAVHRQRMKETFDESVPAVRS